MDKRFDELDAQIAIEQRKWRQSGMRAAVLKFGTWAMESHSAQSSTRWEIIEYLKTEFGLPAKYCSQCKTWKEFSEYTKCTRARDGHLHCCKTCDRANKAKWYAANIQKNREKHRAYWRTAAAKRRSAKNNLI